MDIIRNKNKDLENNSQSNNISIKSSAIDTPFGHDARSKPSSSGRFPNQPEKRQSFLSKLWTWIKKHLWLCIAAIIILVGLIIAAVIYLPDKTTLVSDNPVVKNYNEKLPELKESVKNNPDSASSHNNYAQALYVTGDKEKARDEYKKAAKLDPKNGSVQNNLGNTYRDLGDTDKAVAAYKKAIEIDPHSPNAYTNLANLQIYTLKKPADGIKTYKKAIKSNGDSIQFQLLLGLAYEQNEQPDKAKQMYKAILNDDKDNQAAKDNLKRLEDK